MNLIGHESHHITIKQGNTLKLTFDFNEPDNIPLNLSGCTARLQLKFLRNNALIIDATTENGLLLIDEPETGLVKLDVSAFEMAHAPLGRHKFDLKLTFPNDDILSSDLYILDILKSVTAEYEQGTPGTPGYSGIYYPYTFTATTNWINENIAATDICRVLNLILDPINGDIHITIETIINGNHVWGLLKAWLNHGILSAEWIIEPAIAIVIGNSVRIHSVNMFTH